MATVPLGFFVTANAGEALVSANTPAVASPAMPSADPANSAGRCTGGRAESRVWWLSRCGTAEMRLRAASAAAKIC